MNAAQRVMAHKSFDSTTIQDITEAADVGFGSFYNHFESKEAIVEAITRERIEPLGNALDDLARVLDDPAEVLSASVRHVLRRAKDDTVLGRFVFLSGLDMPFVRIGLRDRLVRNLKAGTMAGRFDVADLGCTTFVISGAVYAVVRGSLRGEIGDNGPERAATLILRLVGLSQKEARKVANRPLPEMPVHG